MTQLPRDGVYTLRVYLMRAAARRNESARYVMGVSVTGAASQPAAAPGPSNSVWNCWASASRSAAPTRARATMCASCPAGLLIDNTPIEMEVAGQVVARGRRPERGPLAGALRLRARTAPEHRGTLIAVSANNRKSLGFVNLPELSEHRGASAGYRGHDDMAVVEGRFVRRFPLYGKDGDPVEPRGRRGNCSRSWPREGPWMLKLAACSSTEPRGKARAGPERRSPLRLRGPGLRCQRHRVGLPASPRRCRRWNNRPSADGPTPRTCALSRSSRPA